MDNMLSKLSTLDVNSKTIIKLALAAVLLYALYEVKSVIIWFIFALIIAVLFNFLIDSLERQRVPRVVSATVLYFGVFVLIGLGIFKTAHIMLSEIQEFYSNVPLYLRKISTLFEKVGIDAFRNTQALTQALQDNLDQTGGSFWKALASIFGSASATAFVLALAFFISLERKFIERLVALFFPSQHHEYMFSLWRRARKKVSGWFITRIIGVVFVGLCMLAILMIFNVKYSFLLALAAGLLDFLPIFGPLVAGILMFAVVSLNSLYQAIFVVIAFLVVQELENKLLFPLLFKKFIGISPVLVLVAFAVGQILWGFAGGVLAIPMAGVAHEIIKDYLVKIRKERGELLTESD